MRIYFVSFVVGRRVTGKTFDLTSLGDFLRLYCETTRMSRARDEMQREMETRMRAAFKMRMFWRIWWGMKMAVSLLPSAEIK